MLDMIFTVIETLILAFFALVVLALLWFAFEGIFIGACALLGIVYSETIAVTAFSIICLIIIFLY